MQQVSDAQMMMEDYSYSRVVKLPYTNNSLLIADEFTLETDTFVYSLFFFLAIMLVVVAFSLYTLYYFDRYIRQPFLRFQKDINNYSLVQKKNKQRGFLEVNETVKAFTAISHQLEQLKIDSYEDRITLAKTELEYFQLQIKPHFFVNCFGILFGMAQKKDYDRIQQFCLKSSNYVRYLFKNGLTTVSLQEELAIIREYLDIQDIRHKTQIEMKSNIDAALLNAQIPPLLLLSFVENSIKHSSTDRINLSITINVTSYTHEGETYLHLSVLDNGPGYKKDMLNELNTITSEFPPKRTSEDSHIGVRNTCNRLFLFYGTQYSINFSNQNGHAFVELTIPYKHE